MPVPYTIEQLICTTPIDGVTLHAQLTSILSAISATNSAISNLTTVLQNEQSQTRQKIGDESAAIQNKLQTLYDFLNTQLNTYNGYKSTKDEYKEEVEEGEDENKEKLRASSSVLHRIREIFEVNMDMGPLTAGAGAMNAAAPLQKLLTEFQTKKDANGDGKIYGWDFVFMDPPPMLASVRKQEGAEEIPGPPTEDGKYPE